MVQYQAYCYELNYRNYIRLINHRSVRGIGESEKEIGIASIDIPFEGLKLIINVRLLILSKNIPALFAMKDMVTNGL